jgi:hypothetical protein
MQGKMDLGNYTIHLTTFMEARMGEAEKDRRYRQ